MDYSAANPGMWNFIIQLGVIAITVLLANILRRKVPFVKGSLMPVSVLAGFLLLIVKVLGIFQLDNNLMEMLVYHCIAMGFIAMSLRQTKKDKSAEAKSAGFKSGAIIVGTYLVQGTVGLLITLLLAHTFMPDMFEAAGLLLPMGYGQGPGQANNIGSSYESLGFAGGRSFGMAIAAAGYLCACTVGVIILNRWKKKGLVQGRIASESNETASEGFFQDKNEIPVTDSIDKLSVQAVMVLFVYLCTYLVTWGITAGITAVAPGLGKMVNSLLWGFNFIVGSVIAMLVSRGLDAARKKGIVHRQYQNNYLLNRLSGFFFDIMIVAGIASINPEDISGLWVPFLLIAIGGGIITWLYLKLVCKKAYGDYYKEGLISMYGMLTGTIGSGVLLLREIDPDLSTPAANNLVVGSSYAIVLGAPLLVFVSLAAESTLMCLITLALLILYGGALTFILVRKKKR